MYGLTQWTTVAKEIPGRTDIQCRYHFLRQKNSRIIPWNDEEDNLLLKLVDEHGLNWLHISDTMATCKLRRTPRTALECQERYELVKAKK